MSILQPSQSRLAAFGGLFSVKQEEGDQEEE